MKVIKNEQLVFIDVDDTLVKWEQPIHLPGAKRIEIEDATDNSIVFLEPHLKHIELLKKYKARGYTVTVWSGGGYMWAESVVKTLGLEEHVDFVMTKPSKYVDDLPCTEWMGARIYLKDYGEPE